MNASLERRICVSSCWATSRIAVLDGIERYEDSYAITQEFREWIVCLGEHPEKLKDSVLMVPSTFKSDLVEEVSDSDEVIEI